MHRLRVVLLALALITEALQFFAVNRHPRLLDIGIDMAGALLAVVIMALRGRWTGAGPSRRQ